VILLLVAAGAAAVLGALAVTDIGDALLAWIAHTWGAVVDPLVGPLVDTVKGWFA
jgi:hypothetical protein